MEIEVKEQNPLEVISQLQVNAYNNKPLKTIPNFITILEEDVI